MEVVSCVAAKVVEVVEVWQSYNNEDCIAKVANRPSAVAFSLYGGKRHSVGLIRLAQWPRVMSQASI